MESSRLASLIDGVTGNLLTDALKQVVRPIVDSQTIKVAIRRTANVHPYSNVDGWLPALVDEVPDVAERGSEEAFAKFAERCLEVARTAGNVLDAPTAAAIARTFISHLDTATLTIGEHDQRERERSELIRKDLDDLKVELRDVRQDVKLAVSRGTLTPPPISEPSTGAEHEIAAIAALVSSGAFITADERLAALANVALTEDLSFRVATLAGICAYERNDKLKAVSRFESARDQRPRSAIAVSNVAAAYLSIDDGDRALTEARNAWLLDPDTGSANYIAALHYTSHDDGIAAFIPADLDNFKNADVLLALARIYLERGLYSTSERLASKAVELSASPDAKEALAISLIGQFGFSRLRASATTLRAAEQLLTDAIDARRTWQTHDDVARCLLNRGVIRCLSREYGDALRDIDRALDEQDLPEAHVLRARVLATLGRHAEAIAEFERTVQSTAHDDAVLAYAYCLIEAGRPSEALPWLDDALERATTAADRLDVVQIAIAAADALDDMALGEAYVLKIGQNESSRWATHAARGYLCLRRGHLDRAIRELSDAGERAPAEAAVLIRINLARALGRDRQWSAAANTYASCVTSDSDLELVQSLAGALYNASRYQELTSLYEQCVESSRLSRVLRALRARVFENSGDLRAARELYVANAISADGESEDYLRAAVLSWRLRDEKRAHELIPKIAARGLIREPRLLMLLAELHDVLAIDPMKVAYAACMINDSRPDIPATYARLYQAWRPAVERPVSVSPECAVTVKIASSSLLVTIVVSDDSMHSDLPRHCRTSSERGRVLMGRAVGDLITLPFDGASSVAKIVTMEHKLDYAYRDAFELSRARFGTAAQMGALDDEYVASLKDAPEGKALRERRRQMQQQYAMGSLALGPAADRSRIPTIRFFCRNMFSTGSMVQAFTGVYEEAQLQRAALHVAKEVVLDLTAIVTLARLNLLDTVANAFAWIGVTQWTVDSFIFTRRDVFGSDEAPTIGVVDGDKVISKEVDQAFYSNERGMLDRCIAFVELHAAIVPVPDVVQMPRRELVRSMQKYGREMAMSVFAAARRSAVLLLDDVVTQRLAAADGVKAVGTQVFLEALRERDGISREQYVDALATLSALNYRFIRLGPRDLYIALTSSLTRSAAFEELILRLGDPECDENSVILVGANLLRGLCLPALASSEQRRSATAAVVLVAALTRGPAVVLALRDVFLTSVAREWYEAAGDLDNAVSEVVGAFRRSLDRLTLARSRVRPRFSDRQGLSVARRRRERRSPADQH